MAYSHEIFLSSNLTADNVSNGHFCDPFIDPECGYIEEPFSLTTGKIVSAIGIAILIIASLVGNIFVCVAFCYYKRLRTVPNYFIVSLAVSDIMVAAFSMPLWLSVEVTGWEQLPAWVDFFVLYKYWECIDILSCVSSIANLAAISLDRLFSIIAPLRHRTRMTPIVALIMIVFAWLYAFTVSLTSLIDYNDYTTITAVLGFFFPLLIIVSSYLGIYIKYRIRSSKQGTLVGDWNLERTLLIVIGLFVICWLPFFILTLTYRYCLSCEFTKESIEHLRGFVKWMHYLNSCCNPIVYGFCNINFKTAFWALLGSCFSKRYSDMNLVPCSRETSNSQAGTVLRHLKSIKRKLSWKRDVDESIVSNGGEVNDNSLSLAVLALQLKNGQSVENQESQALVEMSDSRPSSKASEDVGLLSDEWSSAHESSSDEVGGNSSQKSSDFGCIMKNAQLGPIDSAYSTYEDNQSHEKSNSISSIARMEVTGLDIAIISNEAQIEEESKLRITRISDHVGEKFLPSKYSAQRTKRKWLNEIEDFESEDSTSDYGEALVHLDSRDSSPQVHISFSANDIQQNKRRRSGVDIVTIVDIEKDVPTEIGVDGNEELIIKEDMIDTKESIV